MTKLQLKKLINNKVLIALPLFGVLLGSCLSDPTGTVAEGKIIYSDNCVACHSLKSSFNNQSSLLQLSSLDSVQLATKIHGMRVDSIHAPYSRKLSDRDLQSISLYIKDIRTLRY